MSLTPDLILCNDYKLIEPIGRGGMGAIWRARDLVGERDVALKFVPRDLQNFEAEIARVAEMFALVEKLHHQHICPLYAMKDAGEHGKFLVMQFVPGLPLDKFAVLTRQKVGDFPVLKLVSVLRPIASALDYAHTRPKRVIHRDVKPANILVVTDDDLRVVDVQLIDFGLAATFRTSLSRVSKVRLNISGTYPYMAPEQWDGAFQDAATDQYALGITAYELLAGHFPFASDDTRILEKCVKNNPIPPIVTLSRAQNAVLCRALAKGRKERFPNCVDFIDALAKAQTGNLDSVGNCTTFAVPAAPQDKFARFRAEVERKEQERRAEEERKEQERREQLADDALEAYQSGRYSVAIPLLNEYLTYCPENENAKWLLARCEERIQTTSEASFEMDGSTLKKFVGTETEVIIPAIIQGQPVTAIGIEVFYDCSSLTSVVIPEGVTVIGGRAFYGCSSLTSVVIPDSVQKIDRGAFAYCTALKQWSISSDHSYFKTDGTGLLTKDGKKLLACLGSATEYRIPEGVTEIGDCAFYGCSSLTSVVIPEGVKEIGGYAFDGCRSLTSVVIPEGVTGIGSGAFWGCSSLTSVVIPANVTSIRPGAFDHCSKGLVIHAPKGSAAQEYARRNGIRWEI